MPSAVKVSMVSVTMSALPLRSALNRSPSGTTHSRWSHGSYLGVKCCRSASAPRCLRAPARTSLRIHAGRRWAKPYIARWMTMLRPRASR